MKKKGKTAKEKRPKRKSRAPNLEERIDTVAEEFDTLIERFFAEEFGTLMERFCQKIGKIGQEHGEKLRTWWLQTFGIVGPFISALFGVLLLLIPVYIIEHSLLWTEVRFLTNLSGFIIGTLPLFFAVFLISGYDKYFSAGSRGFRLLISPALKAVGFTFVLFVMSWALFDAYLATNMDLFWTPAYLISANLPEIFLTLAFLSYFFTLLRK